MTTDLTPKQKEAYKNLPKSGETVNIAGKPVSKEDMFTGDGRYIGPRPASED